MSQVAASAELAPLAIAAYYESDGFYNHMRAEDEAVLAEVGRIVAAAFGPPAKA